jgi:hypothetical protein
MEIIGTGKVVNSRSRIVARYENATCKATLIKGKTPKESDFLIKVQLSNELSKNQRIFKDELYTIIITNVNKVVKIISCKLAPVQTNNIITFIGLDVSFEEIQ